MRDGDTIEVTGLPIRLGSLDRAERGTVKGAMATAEMRRIVAGQRLECRLTNRRSYDRTIGECQLPDGRSISRVMIKEGYCRRWR